MNAKRVILTYLLAVAMQIARAQSNPTTAHNLKSTGYGLSYTLQLKEVGGYLPMVGMPHIDSNDGVCETECGSYGNAQRVYLTGCGGYGESCDCEAQTHPELGFTSVTMRRANDCLPGNFVCSFNINHYNLRDSTMLPGCMVWRFEYLYNSPALPCWYPPTVHLAV